MKIENQTFRQIASDAAVVICFLIILVCLIKLGYFKYEDVAVRELLVEYVPSPGRLMTTDAQYHPDIPAYDSSNNQNPADPSSGFDGPDKQITNAAGYIYIEGTSISYPVMWSSSDGYYLTHTYDDSRNRNGAIYLSFMNDPDFSDPINYIFGHNMLSGLMFAPLNDFLDQTYLKTHKDCYLITSNIAQHYTLFFSESVTEDTTMKYFEEACMEHEEYRDYIMNISQRSGTLLPEDARLIILCTCTKGKRQNRTLVYGYLDSEQSDGR